MRIEHVDLITFDKKKFIVRSMELFANNRPIMMVVLASAVEGSFDVKRAQCSGTKMRMFELRVYMALQNDLVGCSALRSLG